MKKIDGLAGNDPAYRVLEQAAGKRPAAGRGGTRVGRRSRHRSLALALALALAAAAAVPGLAAAQSQCTPVLDGLKTPVGSLLSHQGNLLVAESGDGSAGSGRISVVDRHGKRRTLIDGLPSAPSDVGTPSGPSGLYLDGVTLFVAIGTGDTGILGPRPGTTVPNPNGASSPIFSSVLALTYSGAAERKTTGFTMTPAQQASLAKGRVVVLHDGHGHLMLARMVTNFPEYVPSPIPGVPDNISVSNPFGIVGRGASLYVTDGGRNLAWRVGRWTGSRSEFVQFPNVPNPLFPQVGGPMIQAVPTGINVSKNGKLLVSLIRGAPFPTGVSSIEQIDPVTGKDVPLISGLTTAIDTAPMRGAHGPLLVLEMAASGPFFSGPGTVLRFDAPDVAPQPVADCLVRPTSMTLDESGRSLYVTEEEGNLIRIAYP